MSKTKIALVQMKMSSDPKKNIQNAIDKINTAAKKGAKVICLPELFLTKYFPQVESHKNFNFAEKIPGPSPTRCESPTRSRPAPSISTITSARPRRAQSAGTNNQVMAARMAGKACAASCRQNQSGCLPVRASRRPSNAKVTKLEYARLIDDLV